MPRGEGPRTVISGDDLLRKAEKDSPGVSEILRLYLRAMKAIEQDLGVEAEQARDAVYYTTDSTAVC
jgi:hypothetical protein